MYRVPCLTSVRERLTGCGAGKLMGGRSITPSSWRRGGGGGRGGERERKGEKGEEGRRGEKEEEGKEGVKEE